MKSKTLSSEIVQEQLATIPEARQAIQSWNTVRYNEVQVLSYFGQTPAFLINRSTYSFLKENQGKETLLNMYLGVENGQLCLFNILEKTDDNLFENPNLPNVIIHKSPTVSEKDLVEMGFLTEFPVSSSGRDPLGIAEAWRRLSLWNICRSQFIKSTIENAASTSLPSDEKGVVRVFEAEVDQIILEFEINGANTDSVLAFFGLKQNDKGETVTDLSFWAVPNGAERNLTHPKVTVMDFTTPKPPFGMDKSTGEKHYPVKYGLAAFNPNK